MCIASITFDSYEIFCRILTELMFSPFDCRQSVRLSSLIQSINYQLLIGLFVDSTINLIFRFSERLHRDYSITELPRVCVCVCICETKRGREKERVYINDTHTHTHTHIYIYIYKTVEKASWIHYFQLICAYEFIYIRIHNIYIYIYIYIYILV